MIRDEMIVRIGLMQHELAKLDPSAEVLAISYCPAMNPLMRVQLSDRSFGREFAGEMADVVGGDHLSLVKGDVMFVAVRDGAWLHGKMRVQPS